MDLLQPELKGHVPFDGFLEPLHTSFPCCWHNASESTRMESWVINVSSQEEARSLNYQLLMRADQMLDIFCGYSTHEFILPMFLFLWGSLSTNSPANKFLGRKNLRSSQVLKKTCGKGIFRFSYSNFIQGIGSVVRVHLVRVQKDATWSNDPRKKIDQMSSLLDFKYSHPDACHLPTFSRQLFKN